MPFINERFQMITINDIKKVLFSTEKRKEQLIQAIRKYHPYEDTNDFDMAFYALFYGISDDPFQIQKNLAPFLRETAIDHIRTSPRFAGFRAQQGDRLDAYLAYQAQPYKFGADEEADALAELFNVSLVIVALGHNQSMHVSPKYTAGPDRPILQVYNLNNNHWCMDKNKPSKTLGDGNCLYNFYAQFLVKQINEEPCGIISRDAFADLLTQAKQAIHKMGTTADFQSAKRAYEKQCELLEQNLDTASLLQFLLEMSIKENREYPDHLCAVKMVLDELPLPPRYTKQQQNVLCAVQKMQEYFANENAPLAYAIELENLTKAYFKKQTPSKRDTEVFQKKVFKCLEHIQSTMKNPTPSWQAILANVVLAFTGVGIFLIIQRVASQGLLFFQETKGDKLEEVKSSILLAVAAG